MAINLTKDHHLWTRDTIKNVSGDVTLDIANDLILDPNTGVTKFSKAGDTDDICTLTVDTDGATVLATHQGLANIDAHLTLDIEGNLKIDTSVNSGEGSIELWRNGAYEGQITIGASDIGIYGQNDLSLTALGTGGGAGDIKLTASDAIILDSGESVKVDKDINNTTAATNDPGLWVDYDRIGNAGSGADNNIGIDLDVNVTGSTAATPSAVGMDVDVVGDTAGLFTTSTNTGIDITTSGADKNFGLKINNEDNGTTDGTEADFINYSSANAADYFYMNTFANGETELGTIDSGGTDGHIKLQPNGKLQIHAGSGANPYAYFQVVNPYSRLRMNGYIQDDDYLQIDVEADGATTISTVDDAGADAHINIEADGHVEFDNCAVGFDGLEATFSTTAVIESGGSDDTDIDFRLSNKYRLEMINDIAQMNLIFPNTSGNFLLVCDITGAGGGDHDVTAWKVWEHDSAAGSTNAAAVTDVMWAGGSVPAFTSGAATDIVSFYWDADEQQCYGVASLAFATP